MGMSIDTSLLYESGYNKGFKDGIKGSIPKADYEAKLKADMLSMLYKLRSEIINMPKYFPYADHTRMFIDSDVVVGFIDNKIDTLRENEDGKID